MKNCPTCGLPTPDKSRYCGNCCYQFLFDDTNINVVRVTAAVFAIFLGGLGAHKFYLKKPKQGIFYIIFCWTFIPSLIGLLEGIRYLCLSNEQFNLIYNKDNILTK